jgi:hypothetical protein
VDELRHYGVKGMKWGVRRKRYDNDPETRRLKRTMELAKKKSKLSGLEYSSASNKYSNYPSAKNKAEVNRTRLKYFADRNEYRKAKLAYTTNKEVNRIRDNGIEFKKKSKHRLKLEEQYKKLGLNAEQAQAAANNRIRTEKILAASATVTVAACAAYIANKKRRNRIDGVIKAGEMLQRVEMQDTGGKLHDVFYTSKGKHDNKRYENLLGFARKNATGEAYLMKLKANADIKVASKDNAVKAFGDLYKNDPGFKKAVESHVGKHFGGGNIIKDTNNLSKRNVAKMYENFNANIMHIRDSGSGADKQFFNKLKSAGYGAIQDINDMKYSGYSAKNPLIVFDNSKNNIMVSSVKNITKEAGGGRATVELLKATGESSAKRFLEKAGPMTAAGLTVTTATTYKTDPNKYYNK